MTGESAHLLPMCPGFDSRTRRHTWVEFVAGFLSLLREVFLRELPFSSLLKNQNFQIPFGLEWTYTYKRVRHSS